MIYPVIARRRCLGLEFEKLRYAMGISRNAFPRNATRILLRNFGRLVIRFFIGIVVPLFLSFFCTFSDQTGSIFAVYLSCDRLGRNHQSNNKSPSLGLLILKLPLLPATPRYILGEFFVVERALKVSRTKVTSMLIFEAKSCEWPIGKFGPNRHIGFKVVARLSLNFSFRIHPENHGCLPGCYDKRLLVGHQRQFLLDTSWCARRQVIIRRVCDEDFSLDQRLCTD